jgi:hypothetical protein
MEEKFKVEIIPQHFQVSFFYEIINILGGITQTSSGGGSVLVNSSNMTPNA